MTVTLNWNGDPRPTVASAHPITVLEVILPKLNVVEKNEGIDQARFLKESQPRGELWLMYGHAHYSVSRNIMNASAALRPHCVPRA